MNNHDATVSLSTDDGHQRYVALVGGPVALPRVAVGAFTPPEAPGPARALFMTSMDLETARSYAEAILATCRMAQLDLDESQGHDQAVDRNELPWH
jgi:2-hydroxychromene-2-carboxylate isomerase